MSSVLFAPACINDGEDDEIDVAGGGKSDSTTEVLTESGKIYGLAGSAEGLFWIRESPSFLVTLMQLDPGATAATEVRVMPNEASSVRIASGGNTVYAGGGLGGDFLFKQTGQPVQVRRNALADDENQWRGEGILFATPTEVFLAPGWGYPYNPITNIVARAIPDCLNNCSLGDRMVFYAGGQEWPATQVGTGDGEMVYFVSERYGNYPGNDVKRTHWKIMGRRASSSGPAVELLTGTGANGPHQLVVAGGALFYLIDVNNGRNEIVRLDLTTKAVRVLFSPAEGIGRPLYIATDGHDVFWLDTLRRVSVLREGATAVEILATDADYTNPPHNLALTEDHVYFTQNQRSMLARVHR